MPFYTTDAIATLGKPSLYVPASDLAPVNLSSPTVAEITAYAESLSISSQLLKYDGLDVDSEVYKRIYLVASNGSVTEIEDDSGSPATTYSLTVVAQNTINDLPSVPLGSVDYYVNGSLVDGISNVEKAVSVDPLLVGYNVALHDLVKARYSD